MKKTVSSGKRMTTVNLDGTECEVVFSSSYNVFSVKSENTVTMALESGKSEGDDGVITVPAGESRMYPHMRGLKSIFITGSGKVEVFASNEAVNPFKSAPVNNGGYKANLLINPDFKINQRAVSGEFSEAGKYFVDRWKLDSGTVTINSDATLTLNGTISQILENAAGTNVTASVSAGTASYDDSTKTFTITGNGVTISWAKLEIGSTPTPFSPPDTATELMKCKRYYQRISGAYRQIANGYIQAANIVMTTTPLQQMRINGVTGKFVGTAYIWYKNHIASEGAVSTTIITPINLSQNLATLGFNLNSAVDASYIGLPCLVQLRDYDSYIEFDAEL